MYSCVETFLLATGPPVRLAASSPETPDKQDMPDWCAPHSEALFSAAHRVSSSTFSPSPDNSDSGDYDYDEQD